MSCISPRTISTPQIKQLFKLGLIPTSSIDVSCGKCLNCRITRQSQLSFLCGKEMLEQYKLGRGNSFITLTYDDNHIPINDKGYVTLRKRDFQLFMKRVRRNLDYHYGIHDNSCKYLACGEYGDSFGRPHIHLCLFGISTEMAKVITRKVWKYGICDIGVLTSGGIRYVCKYMTKSLPPDTVKELREDKQVENPFITHSIGLGKDWINKNLDKIVQNDFQFNFNGKKSFYPKYVLRYVSLKTGKDYRKIISQAMNRKDYYEWRKRLDTFSTLDDYRKEKDMLNMETNIRVLRAKGIPVDPSQVSLSRQYRPISRRDRQYIYNLASHAQNVAYGVPF